MKTSKNLTNLQISKLLKSVAAALSLTPGDNRFKVIAYERAADAVEHATSEVKDLWDDGKLQTLAGIGPAISSHLDELFRTGKVRHYNSIVKPFPPAMFEIMEVPGIGPKTAYRLCKELGITKAHSAISLLEKAAKRGHIRVLEGFGEQSESEIVKNLVELKGRSRRLLLNQAETIAQNIVAWLHKCSAVKQADPLGSLRRQSSTVGDIDIAVASTNPEQVIAHFCKYPYQSRVLESGPHTASLILPNEYQVDLMVQPPESYGSLLQHFTGSKHHNIALREYALKRRWSLSEYGIKTSISQKKFPDEAKFYKFLKMDWIPPELREGRGEIAAALNHTLPQLVSLSEIRGDLQIHSNINTESSHDLGTSSLSQLSSMAESLGYEYLGLTEHNPNLTKHTTGQIIELIKRKNHQIREFISPVKLFSGLEIDIQTDGTRALPDSALDLLDYACISIHSSFRSDRKKMTDRVLKAFAHPKIKFFAHPTGRLLGEREGVELDWDRVFQFCLEHHKWLEIDGWPNRLDLPDSLVHEAVKAGVKLIIDTDSHDVNGLNMMKYGVSVARRGWAKKSDILNTLSLSEFSPLLLQ